MNRFAALLAVCALTLAGCTTSAADPEEAEFLASVDLQVWTRWGSSTTWTLSSWRPVRRI